MRGGCDVGVWKYEDIQLRTIASSSTTQLQSSLADGDYIPFPTDTSSYHLSQTTLVKKFLVSLAGGE